MANNPLRAKTEDNPRLPRDLLLLLVYFLLAIALTWPTILHLPTHLPGDGSDDPAIAWNLWWVKYALLNARQTPFQTNFMFYPLGINLAFYTLTTLNALTALPLTLNLGLVTASNLHMLFTFVIGGYGTFLLTRYILTENPFADAGPRSPVPGLIWASAAIAGGFYAFASSKLFYIALGQFNIASSQWVPLAILYVLRTRRDPHRLKNPLMAGLFLSLQAWTELTYASFLLVFMGLYGLWQVGYGLWSHRRSLAHTLTRHSLLPHLRAAVVMGLTFALGLSPILAQMLPDLRAEGDFLVEGSGFAADFSADVLGFVIPTIHHPLLGNLITQTSIRNFSLGQHIYLGFTLLGLLLIAVWTSHRRVELRFWLVSAIFFALLCLGPLITVNGHVTDLPGPFVLLQNLPFFKGNRYPSRYSVMLLLSLSIIAAFALVQLGRWVNRQRSIANGQWSIFTLIALLFLFEHLSLPLPQSDMRVPAPYQLIAADPGDFAVLDVPFAWRNGFRITGAMTTQFMFGQFYQTVHQKRLLQGNTSRNPEFKFQYFTDAPVINSLLALETGQPLPPQRWSTDQAIAAEVLAFFNIKYIVVRPYRYQKFDGQKTISVSEQGVLPYIEDVLPVEKIHDEIAIKIYRVIPKEEARPQSGYLIDTSSPLAPLYFGEGWGLLTTGQPITAQRQQVRLLLSLTGAVQRVTLRLRLPEGYQDSSQSVRLTLNGWQSPPQTLGQKWQDLTFDLPAGVAYPGLNNLRLNFNAVMLGPAQTESRTLSQITVISAGEEVGDFAHIFVNGRDISPNQRGYNVAIVAPGQTIQTALFDTHLDPAASSGLVNFLAAAPADAFIAVAAADEASAKLSEETVRALQGVGAKGDLRGCFRCSHAFIRLPSGATLEALDALRPVGLTTGLGLTEPALAAQVEWIKIEPVEP